MANQYIPHIPEYIPGTKHTPETRFKYYRITSDNTWIELKRAEFFKLVATVNSPCEHICPDLSGGIVWFTDMPTDIQRQEYAALCREMERDKKRDQRAHQCPYVNTSKCDGWKRDQNGERRCDLCVSYGYSRQLSLDACVTDDEGGVDSDVERLKSTEPTPEEIILHDSELEQLAQLLSVLPDKDRQLLWASQQPDMDSAVLAQRFGFNSRNAVLKRVRRLLARLRNDAQKEI